mgnify:FL=1
MLQDLPSIMEDQEIVIETISSEVSQLQSLICDIGNKIEELEKQQVHCKHLLMGFEWYHAHLKGEEVDTPDTQTILEI